MSNETDPIEIQSALQRGRRLRSEAAFSFLAGIGKLFRTLLPKHKIACRAHTAEFDPTVTG